MSQCETILWLVEPDAQQESERAFRQLCNDDPQLASRVQRVWVLRDNGQIAPRDDQQLPIGDRNFKVNMSVDAERSSTQQQQGVARIVRHLQHRRVGVALGGGGALGLAHLGALRALEQEGIQVDLISGTSMGALVGLTYAAGWDTQEALQSFKTDLSPGRFFRCIPRGKAFHLLWKFRSQGWDAMLRPYFADAHLDQLHVPLSTVTVDLIRGCQVIRDRGDAIEAVLESINLPGISRPIMKQGMALTDGGVLNNVPVDVVRQRGADMVIAIDVVGSLPTRFGRNTPATPPDRQHCPGIFDTISRVREVRKYTTRVVDPKLPHAMISVDTSRFSFHDFTQAFELAECGEAATQAVMPEIRRQLAELSPAAYSESL
jgi:predicted acylesterase/phospholipase RssA